MFTSLQMHLAGVFLKIFLRNRQAILFSLFFPLIFIGAFSFSGGERDPFLIGVADQSKSSISTLNRRAQVYNRIRIIIDNFYFGVIPIYAIVRSLILMITPLKVISLLKTKFYKWELI